MSVSPLMNVFMRNIISVDLIRKGNLLSAWSVSHGKQSLGAYSAGGKTEKDIGKHQGMCKKCVCVCPWFGWCLCEWSDKDGDRGTGLSLEVKLNNNNSAQATLESFAPQAHNLKETL